MKKKTMKRNQIIIGALTVLLGVAGYINSPAINWIWHRASWNRLNLPLQRSRRRQMQNQRRLCPAS